MLNTLAIHSIYDAIFRFNNDSIAYDIVIEILKDHFCENDNDAKEFDEAVSKALSSFNKSRDINQSVRLVCRNTHQADYDRPLSLSDMAGNDCDY